MTTTTDTPREIAERIADDFREKKWWTGDLVRAIESAITEYGRQCTEAERERCALMLEEMTETHWNCGNGKNALISGAAAIRERSPQK